MEQGPQFLGMPKVILDHKDPKGGDTGHRTLEMHNPGEPVGSLAHINYEVSDDDPNDDEAAFPEYRGIEYINSNEENKGHMTTLLHHLYQNDPEGQFDWGHIIHPAAEHLFFKFQNKYGRSRADSFPGDRDEDHG
jgi:hypothetical protein